MRITKHQLSISNRFHLDDGVCSVQNGFVPVRTEQDDRIYGTWSNPVKLVTTSFIEGEVVTRQAIDSEEYIRDLRDLRRWNLEHGYTFTGIDCRESDTEGAFIKLGLSDLIYQTATV